MTNHTIDLGIRSKIWLVDASGEVVFGLGRLKMLQAIETHGSINGAAKALKMSNRRIWGRIKVTEERLGRPLLVRNVGGTAGGGSQLTDYAKSLIDYFQFLNESVVQQSNRLFDDTCMEKLVQPLCKGSETERQEQE